MAPFALALLLAAAGADLGGSFEGQRLAAVRIDADPSVAARLSRYIELAPGDALTGSRIRHIVELMYTTGEFEDVVVDGEPGEGGWTLVFRPVPAALLQQVEVTGDRVLSPAQLRRIARLRTGEPLWPARLDQAARDTALALSEAGYREARVSGSVRRGPRGATAVFEVAGGPLARVEKVQIEGAHAALTASLQPLVRPRPGEAFRHSRVIRAMEQMRRHLVGTGRWRASVDHLEAYDPGTGRMRLTFLVSPGPRTVVAFRGGGVPASLRRQLLDLLRDGGLRGDVLEEASDRIESDLRRRGYRHSEVTVTQTPTGDTATYLFEVQPGPLVMVGSVRLLGDVPDDLTVLMQTRTGQPFQERVLEDDARMLLRTLQERGHAEARLEPEVPDEGESLAIVIRVNAGPRTTVRSMKLDSPATLPSDVEARELRVRAGVPYVATALARDRNTLLSAYRDGGYLQAEVTPEVTFSEDKSVADVVLRVIPGPQTTVDHVVIAGLKRTREAIVRRELRLQEGSPLGLQKVVESQRRLGALGIFQRASIAEMDPESVSARSLVVRADEAPPVAIAYGIGYAERDQVRGSVELTRRNLFGMDRSLSTFARASFKGSRFFTTFREPYLLGHKQELFLTGYREEEDRTSFDFIRYGGLLQTARSLSARWSVIVRYTYQQTDLFRIEVPLEEVDRQFRSSTISGPSTSVVNDTRDDPLDPRRGRFLGADVQLSHAALGGDSFLKGFVQASTYERLTSRLVLALNGRLGLASTFGLGEPLRLPLADRFFAGGDYSLRGYAIDTAGPRELSASGRLVPTGGNAMVLGGAELRMDTGRFLSLAAFSDFGNVYPLVSDLDLGDLRYTAGLGVRYRSALGPLRVDWGYKLNRRSGERPYHVHVTIGHAF
jgi:outer membrane protein insertion porin family